MDADESDNDFLDAAWKDLPRDKDGFIDALPMPEGMYDEAVKVWKKKGDDEKDPDASKGRKAGVAEDPEVGN